MGTVNIYRLSQIIIYTCYLLSIDSITVTLTTGGSDATFFNS